MPSRRHEEIAIGSKEPERILDNCVKPSVAVVAVVLSTPARRRMSPKYKTSRARRHQSNLAEIASTVHICTSAPIPRGETVATPAAYLAVTHGVRRLARSSGLSGSQWRTHSPHSRQFVSDLLCLSGIIPKYSPDEASLRRRATQKAKLGIVHGTYPHNGR